MRGVIFCLVLLLGGCSRLPVAVLEQAESCQSAHMINAFEAKVHKEWRRLSPNSTNGRREDFEALKERYDRYLTKMVRKCRKGFSIEATGPWYIRTVETGDGKYKWESYRERKKEDKR